MITIVALSWPQQIVIVLRSELVGSELVDRVTWICCKGIK